MIPAADLFCGLGGFTKGAEGTGRVDVVLAVDHWLKAVEFHRLNHPDVPHLQQDLLEFDMRRLPDLGLLMASPSCKDDTPAGQPAKKGTGGNFRPDALKIAQARASDRNTAVAVLAAAEAKRPPFLVVENVPEFTKRPTFGAWLAYLECIGYSLSWRIVNALEVGGAVDRPRFILVGRLGGKAPEMPVQAMERSSIADCLDPDDHPGNRWKPLGKDTARMKALIRKAKNDAGSRCFVNNVGDGVRGRPLDDVFPSLTTKSGTQFILIDGDRRRVLNPREMARAMGFPDSYQIPTQRGLASELIGNAIHRGVAEYAVGVAIAA